MEKALSGAPGGESRPCTPSRIIFAGISPVRTAPRDYSSLKMNRIRGTPRASPAAPDSAGSCQDLWVSHRIERPACLVIALTRRGHRERIGPLGKIEMELLRVRTVPTRNTESEVSNQTLRVRPEPRFQTVQHLPLRVLTREKVVHRPAEIRCDSGIVRLSGDYDFGRVHPVACMQDDRFFIDERRNSE